MTDVESSPPPYTETVDPHVGYVHEPADHKQLPQYHGYAPVPTQPVQQQQQVYVVTTQPFGLLCENCHQPGVVDKYNVLALVLLIIMVIIYFPTLFGLCCLFLLFVAREKRCEYCHHVTASGGVTAIYILFGLSVVALIALIIVASVLRNTHAY